MKELKNGKSYYSIINRDSQVQVTILRGFKYKKREISPDGSTKLYFSAMQIYSRDQNIIWKKRNKHQWVWIHEGSQVYKNIKEFIGYKEFRKDWNLARKNLLIKDIIE
jgi:hypothetical protein